MGYFRQPVEPRLPSLAASAARTRISDPASVLSETERAARLREGLGARVLGPYGWVLITIALGCALYLPFLGQRPFYAEEGRRALQVIALLNGGSWWRLDVGGALYIAKPPMLPWLMALATFVTGGLNEWAVRLPSVVAVIVAALASGGVAAVIAQSQRLGARKWLAALAASAAFLTCPSIIERTRIGETDLVVTASVAVAFWAFLLARSRNGPFLPHWTAIAVALAIAGLAKGPIPLAFAAVPILGALVLDRAYEKAATAVVVLALSLAPLAFWAYVNSGGDENAVWLDETRLAAFSWLSSAQGWLPLLHLNQVPRWLLGMMPWAALAGWYVWRRRAEALSDPLLRAVLLYAIPVSIVVLLWPGARGRYAVPAIVPVMALAGVFIAGHWTSAIVRRLFALCAVVLSLVAVGLTVTTGRAAPNAELRGNIMALKRIVSERAVRRIFFVDRTQYVFVGPVLFYNFIAYAGLPTRINDFAGSTMPSPRDMLILKEERDLEPVGLERWRFTGEIGSSKLRYYVPATH